MNKIQMVDLKGQYNKLKPQIDAAIQDVIDQTAFINGAPVQTFSDNLSKYLGGVNVIPCGNGTDAIQIALMALDLQPGDEVIVPSFTYVATAEVIALLGLTPVMTDVDPDTFMITPEEIERVVTSRSKAIVPVHLFGQCAPMEEILDVARRHQLFVIEDTAQALGAVYTFSDGTQSAAGTMGDIGCTSFFPSKNLGCYGDGGAIFCKDADRAKRLKMIANHGQAQKYHHTIVGCNSRLDTLQAAILNVKLPHLDAYSRARQKVAQRYDEELSTISWLTCPSRIATSTHVFHQYTIKLHEPTDRDLLQAHLRELGIPSMVYYPIPLHLQEAYRQEAFPLGSFPVAEQLCKHVLSLPIHTEMDDEIQQYIIEGIKKFKA